MVKKGENTRQLIVQKAAELFNIYGFHGCSMTDIMNATGLQKGGIYNHFNGKEAIALAAFDYSFQLVFKRFRDHLDGCANSTEKIFAILKAYESILRDPIMKGGCPIGNTAVDATDTFPELTQKAAEAVQLLQDYIAIKVKEAQEEGSIRPEADGPLFALLVMSTLEGAMVLSRMQKDFSPMDKALMFIEKHIHTQMLTPAAPAANT